MKSGGSGVQSNSMAKRFLTLQECANEARTAVSTVRYWLRVGKLKSIRPGRRRLVPRDSFERFLRTDRGAKE